MLKSVFIGENVRPVLLVLMRRHQTFIFKVAAIVSKRREPSLRFQTPHSFTCPYLIFIFPVRDGSTFPTCVAKLVVPESEDTERITAEFPCSPDVTNPVGGTKGFSQVIFDFVTAYNHEFPLHPDVEYVDTFNVGIVDAKVRVVIEEPGNFYGS